MADRDDITCAWVPHDHIHHGRVWGTVSASAPNTSSAPASVFNHISSSFSLLPPLHFEPYILRIMSDIKVDGFKVRRARGNYAVKVTSGSHGCLRLLRSSPRWQRSSATTASRRRSRRLRRCVRVSLSSLTRCDVPTDIRGLQTNGIFEMRVKNAEGKEAVWTIDLKQTGTVYKGEPKSKANVTIIMSDETFTQLAEGKLDGQKAFMSGKLKTKGNMMFATKLDGILKVRMMCDHASSDVETSRAGRQDEGEAVNVLSSSLLLLSMLWYNHCIRGYPSSTTNKSIYSTTPVCVLNTVRLHLMSFPKLQGLLKNYELIKLRTRRRTSSLQIARCQRTPHVRVPIPKMLCDHCLDPCNTSQLLQLPVRVSQQRLQLLSLD